MMNIFEKNAVKGNTEHHKTFHIFLPKTLDSSLYKKLLGLIHKVCIADILCANRKICYFMVYFVCLFQKNFILLDSVKIE
jgi:hypothetical protein